MTAQQGDTVRVLAELHLEDFLSGVEIDIPAGRVLTVLDVTPVGDLIWAAVRQAHPDEDPFLTVLRASAIGARLDVDGPLHPFYRVAIRRDGQRLTGWVDSARFTEVP